MWELEIIIINYQYFLNTFLVFGLLDAVEYNTNISVAKVLSATVQQYQV